MLIITYGPCSDEVEGMLKKHGIGIVDAWHYFRRGRVAPGQRNVEMVYLCNDTADELRSDVGPLAIDLTQESEPQDLHTTETCNLKSQICNPKSQI